MESVALRRTILVRYNICDSACIVLSLQVILSICYTSGLELADLYPYGTEHGDTLSIGSGLYRPTPLLAPINNLIILSPAGIKAAEYRVNSHTHNHTISALVCNVVQLYTNHALSVHFISNTIYEFITFPCIYRFIVMGVWYWKMMVAGSL